MGIFNNPDINITLNIHLPASDNSELAQLKQFMAENFDQLKEKLAALEPKIDAITTGVQTANTGLTGVSDDLAYLKELLENSPTPEQVAEAVTLVDNLSAKVTPAADAIGALATQLTDLDAQTTRP
jgi:uncharacterized phage infection (PIP) family protein YhgE